MADLSDAAVLKALSGTFARIAGELDQFFPRCAAASRMTGNLLENASGGGRDLTDDDLRAVEQTLSALQTLASKDLEENAIDLPESFGLLNRAGTKDGFENNAGGDFASGVDQEILEEYLAHQETVISEMEELVLSFEQRADARILTALKRLLHTVKGEAGVIGLNRIEKVCHQVEDYIQEAEMNLIPDLLLEFKDWFEQTVNAIKNRTELPAADGLIAALAAGSKRIRQAGDKAEDTETERAGDPVSAMAEKPESPSPEKAPEIVTDVHSGLLKPIPIEDPETTAEFISEANEHFETSDENLLILENDPENEEAIACIFRAFHTIKGVSSFLNLPPISELAHVAENLLDEVRKKRLDFDGLVVDATFNALDLLKKMTGQLEEALVAGARFVPDPELPIVLAQLKKALSGDSVAPVRSPAPRDNETGGKKAVSSHASRESETDRDETVGGNLPQTGRAVKQTMKIDADRIDLLLETIGELVIMESIVSQEASLRRGESRELERNLSQLTKITRSLQDMGMSMRLIPIDNTFRKMGRLVRDLAKKSGKKIELIMEGRETELDKAMVEKLGDPLVHMIRNAVDHGIEATTEARVAAGKDPVGRIVLGAYHHGGNIHIDIRDDGRGLDKEAIAAKAIDRGLIRGGENMSDEEIFALIFEPGFSTAKQITDISGRGVGMDVVKSNIESMRGNVRIASEKGKGSIFTLVLPLTMAIIDGMIVRVGCERYILPLLSIIESFQPSEGMIVTVSGKGETIPFRNRLLPMFRLSSLFNTADAQTDPTKALLVVLEDTGRQIALMVDELLGQNQTVIKNLGEGLRNVEGVAGASIMPDGTPGLIIDVNGLVRMATA